MSENRTDIAPIPERMRRAKANGPTDFDSYVRVMPTPERARRGVEILDEVVTYRSDGRASRTACVLRSIDILAAMERRGAITEEMRQAGEEFRETFRVANLDPLIAADLSRPMVSGRSPSAPGMKVERARESVWQTMLLLGGQHSPAGSCLWHVIGWEMSIKEWAINQGWSGRQVHEKVASGILIGALGVIAEKSS